jgi:hypothetical protein
MRETDLRDTLVGAVETEPPLALDIDDVIASARKETSRRRALLSTAMATVMLVGGIVIAPIAARSMGGVQTAGFPGPPPSAEAPVPTYTREQLAERSAALATEVQSRIATVVPGAAAVVSKSVGAPILRRFVGISQLARFTLDGKPYAIDVTVIASGQRADPTTCVAQTQECFQGEEIADPAFPRAQWVDVVRPDSSVVTVSWHAPATATDGPSPEVVQGYLTVLANDPALHF